MNKIKNNFVLNIKDLKHVNMDKNEYIENKEQINKSRIIVTFEEVKQTIEGLLNILSTDTRFLKTVMSNAKLNQNYKYSLVHNNLEQFSDLIVARIYHKFLHMLNCSPVLVAHERTIITDYLDSEKNTKSEKLKENKKTIKLLYEVDKYSYECISEEVKGFQKKENKTFQTVDLLEIYSLTITMSVVAAEMGYFETIKISPDGDLLSEVSEDLDVDDILDGLDISPVD